MNLIFFSAWKDFNITRSPHSVRNNQVPSKNSARDSFFYKLKNETVSDTNFTQVMDSPQI